MRSNLGEFRLVPQFTATVVTKDWLTVTARSPPVSWGDQTVNTSFSSGKIKMMRSRQNRALHLQVETEEMYAVFSPDRSRLLTGGDGTHPKVHIWDVETGNCLRVLNGHEEPVAALAWSED